MSVASDTDEPAQARTTVQGTINQAIALLRSHDYRTLIEQFVDPSDLAKFNAREGGTESLTKEFGGSEKPKRLLDLLLSIQGASPELTEDGDEAIFHADPSTNPAHGGEIRFHRVHGLWYLRD